MIRILLRQSVFAGCGAVLLLLCGVGCSSMSEEPIPLDITFEELDRKMDQATDPEQRLRNAAGYYQEQMVKTPQFLDDPLTQLVKIWVRKPNELKVLTYESDSPDPHSALILDAQNGWIANYSKENVVKLTPDQLAYMRRLLSFNGPDATMSDSFAKVELAACKIDEQEYYKLTCIPKPPLKNPVYIYVGKHDYLTRRVNTVFDVQGRSIRYESEIIRYSLSDGVMIPVTLKIEVDGQRETTDVTMFRLNPPFRENEFRPPLF